MMSFPANTNLNHIGNGKWKTYNYNQTLMSYLLRIRYTNVNRYANSRLQLKLTLTVVAQVILRDINFRCDK